MANSLERDPFGKCECGCNRAQHSGGLGMCNGFKCRCGRYKKQTREFLHMQMMRDALNAAIEMIEDLPGDGRTIKVCLPNYQERNDMVRQMKAAISGPVTLEKKS
jgi:hypothetical protein